MKNTRKPILFVMLVAILSSCDVVTSTPGIPTATGQLPPSPTSLNTTTPIPGPYDAIPPNPDQQVYVDPEGWYSVNIPAYLKPAGKPNSFSSGQGEFLETGYLPELGSMSKEINVCTWLANIELDPTKSVMDWLSPCSVFTEADDGYRTKYVVYENPGADPDHRFAYIKTSGYPSNLGDLRGRVTFSWLKFISERQSESDIGPEDAAFWKNTIPMPSNIAVTEYALPSEAQNPPEQDGLFRFIPEEARPVSKSTDDTSKKKTLQELGYELRKFAADAGTPVSDIGHDQLFRDGRLLFDHVFQVSEIHSFSTDAGPIDAFVVKVYTEKGPDNFLIQNDAISRPWGDSTIDPELPPILYKGELLWAKVTQDSRVEIKRSNGEVLFTFETYYAASLPRIQFREWNGHWILEVGDFEIEDGEILNTKFGFQEMFNWSLMGDSPIYFFRKGARVGISYGGQILPLQYEEIAHGLCCGPAQNNPDMGSNSLHFFGKRDGIWYYVVVKFD